MKICNFCYTAIAFYILRYFIQIQIYQKNHAKTQKVFKKVVIL